MLQAGVENYGNLIAVHTARFLNQGMQQNRRTLRLSLDGVSGVAKTIMTTVMNCLQSSNSGFEFGILCPLEVIKQTIKIYLTGFLWTFLCLIIIPFYIIKRLLAVTTST